MSVGRILAAVIDRRYRRNFIVQRLGLKTAAFATRAGRVGAITTEQHAHVHFVSFALGPAKKPAHTVPAIVFVFVVTAVAALFPVDDKFLVGLRQFLERKVDVDLLPRTRPQQILLRLAEFFAAKNAHLALLDAEIPVRDRLVQIDRNRPAKAAALRTSSKRIIKTEETGRGRPYVDVAMRAMPTGRKGKLRVES